MSLNFTNEDLRVFRYLIRKTKACKSYIGPENTREVIDKCETAYISEGDNTGFTFHTHPYDTEEPSDVDKVTTEKLGKKYLCIGRVESNEVVCYDIADQFTKVIKRLKL